MESIEKIPSQENDKELNEFRKEIGRLKTEDETNRKKGEEYVSTHFEDLEVEELIEDDMVLWGWFKEGTLTENELKTYGVEVFRAKNKSRQAFYGYVANKLTALLMKKEIEARRAKESGGK